MKVLPQPEKFIITDEYFSLNLCREIFLEISCDSRDYEASKLLKSKIKELTGLNMSINRGYDISPGVIYLKRVEGEEEGYNIKIEKNNITISGNDSSGLYYGIQTLIQIIAQQGTKLEGAVISDKPYFATRGFYHDVTRGKVPTLKTLKELVDRVSHYKINQLQLYIEHTFAFKGLSEVWFDKDPLSPEEILELDEYARAHHVELVPSLSTFGHLYEVLSTKTYAPLCELEGSYGKVFTWSDRMNHHTLDVSNEKSLKLIEEMLREFIPLFSSNKFNICCDETFDLGKGKNLKLNEKLGAGRLYIEFLNKIINCVKKYDKAVMFWGDIIVKHPELIKELPQDIICLNWAYHPGVTEEDTRIISESGIKQFVCPGVGGWNRLMNDMNSSYENISKMIAYGKKYGAAGVLNTDWGDRGHINMFGSSMPGMIYGASLSWNPMDDKTIGEFDGMISELEFGAEGKELVPMLRELSEQESSSWNYIVWWMEQRVLKDEFIDEMRRYFQATDSDKMLKGYYRALEKEKEISELLPKVRAARRIDVNEFICAARGIALMNAACLSIKKHGLNIIDTKLALEEAVLAVELEYWYRNFCELWRIRNKESELGRVGATIKFLCGYLRECVE